MDQYLIKEDLELFFKKKEYLYVATTNEDGTPNVAPKFLIKTERDCIYLADFVIGKTFTNLQRRPKASLSAINLDSLIGYQINGSAVILDSGAEFDEIVQDLEKREVQLSAKRLIEGMQQDKKIKSFELAFPDKLIVIKVAATEIVKITSGGKVEREMK